MEKYIAFIPARAGSKGIPDKNIKLINGKPLLVWTIEHALATPEIEEVFVSSDSPRIQEIAINHGAKAPFLRPEEISDDKSSTESAVLHFIDWAKKSNIDYDNIVLMQATSPFRYEETLSKAINYFKKCNADSLVTVTKTHRFIWKDIENPTASYDIYNRPRRQDINKEDEIYFENGSFYITNKDIYANYSNRLGGKIVMFEMEPEESYEIDDEIDFKFVELLMREYGDKK